MGPLVPEIFSTELNYIIAMLIGIGFGFVLEQAGFSSSRKLAGVFYGYDFVVLRVFFTAAITAMIGVLFLGYFGLLDLGLIFINPTYLWPAIVGGVIMGVGFIIGGFCPGTSITAAVIGKIDAMFFIFGIFIGVFVFGELYPVIGDFYMSSFLGDIKVYESLGLSRGTFAFLLIIIALIAFFVTDRIEKKVNNKTPEPITAKRLVKSPYSWASGVALVIGIILLFMPTYEQKVMNRASQPERIKEFEPEYYTAEKLAFHILDRDLSIQVVDLRSPSEFEKYNIPTSLNMPLDSMLNREWRRYIKENPNQLIFYAENEKDAIKANLIAKELGHHDNAILKNGIGTFKKVIMTPELPQDTTDTQAMHSYKFRKEAGDRLEELRKKFKAVKPKKIKRKIQGGCS